MLPLRLQQEGWLIAGRIRYFLRQMVRKSAVQSAIDHSYYSIAYETFADFD